ncbi:hypothetical protein NEF87_000729 [Candidatus Lokiarchaeum ossiferum]|uniref:GTP-binding protein n=1 Tax=Candidatus Lokiarchaeum ossiferum TaxID=2951803 RepID=A0ABY6HPQ2_9ARCH|nr:hypothetical protein NEF87_000729 [Candidatus Lokiarchaeum sp. B-35]
MLRQVYITKDSEIIYKRDFGKGLDDEGFNQAYKQISSEAFKIATENTQFHDFFKYRINYLSVPEQNVIFFFVSDLSDKFANVKKELSRCRKEFMDMFGSIMDEKLDEDTFEIFDPTIELIHKNLRPKISLVGFSGVGKTTITRLITAEDIPVEHVPTITGDIGTIKIGKLHFHLWDFAGQEQFSFLWNNFIKGSDAVLLITDSSLENCEKSKYFVELIKKEAPYAHAAAIGNKQDLPDALPIADIERHLNIKAYSMIATDPDNRDKMITIIADILEMSGEVSPLLKPLLERDRKLKEAEQALEGGDFLAAVKLFETLADLSLELGDDRVSQDFNEKSQKIRSILKQMAPASQDSSSTPIQNAPKPSVQVPPAPSVQVPPAAPVQVPPKPSVQVPPAPSVQVPPAAPVQVPPKPSVQVPPAPSVQVPPAAPVQVPPKPSVQVPPAPSVQVPPAAPVQVPPKPSVQVPPASSVQVPPAPPVQVPPKPSVQVPPAPKSTVLPDGASQPPQQLDQLGMLLNKLQAKKETPKSPENPLSKATLGISPSILSPINEPSSSNASVSAVIPPPIPHLDQSSNKHDVSPPVKAESISTETKSSVQMVTELKIKLANVNNKMLDLEMENITGDLSDEDYEQKVGRLELLKQKIEKQILEIQNL